MEFEDRYNACCKAKAAASKLAFASEDGLPKSDLNPNNGAIAQLGERVLCKHEVIGSIPVGSTTPSFR